MKKEPSSSSPASASSSLSRLLRVPYTLARGTEACEAVHPNVRGRRAAMRAMLRREGAWLRDALFGAENDQSDGGGKGGDEGEASGSSGAGAEVGTVVAANAEGEAAASSSSPSSVDGATAASTIMAAALDHADELVTRLSPHAPLPHPSQLPPSPSANNGTGAPPPGPPATASNGVAASPEKTKDSSAGAADLSAARDFWRLVFLVLVLVSWPPNAAPPPNAATAAAVASAEAKAGPLIPLGMPRRAAGLGVDAAEFAALCRAYLG